MTMNAGNAACTTGLSKRIHDYAVTAGADGTDTTLKAICYAIAQGVVDEITANGQAVISTGTASLQQYDGSATGVNDTTAPTAERTLSLR